MKTTRILLLYSMLSSAVSISAQELTPFVVSSSGGFYINSTGMLSFTSGEMAAVETYVSPSAILTQGFQQTWDIGTLIAEHPLQNFSFFIYPNPSDGYFSLVTETGVNEYIEVKILDVLGREIFKTSVFHQALINIQPFDLSHAAQGIYLITLDVKDGKSNTTYHFARRMFIVN